MMDTWSNRQVLEQRQARALAGLNTMMYDREISRRVFQDRAAWGWLGEQMCLFAREWQQRRLARDG